MTHQTERLAREGTGLQDPMGDGLYSPAHTDIQIDRRDARIGLYVKLFKLQGEVGKIKKDSVNPYFDKKYFDINNLIEHLTPFLQEYGLLVLQPVRDGVVYSKVIDIDTGEYIHSSIEIPPTTDPQKLGSAISYYRRYGLASLLSQQAEDDDANSASKSASQSKGSSKGAPKRSPKSGGKPDEEKEWLNEGTKDWINATAKVEAGTVKAKDLRNFYKVSNTDMEYFTTLEDEASHERNSLKIEIENEGLPFS